jgi:hypothetical protein
MAMFPQNAGEEQPDPMRHLWIARSIVCAFLGMIYGFLLTCSGFIYAGAGHGTMSLIADFSSPYAVLDALGYHSGLDYLVIPPVFWFAMGGLLGGTRNFTAALAFIALMALHYVVLLLTEMRANAIGYFYHRGIDIIDLALLAIYPLGQVIVWTIFAFQVVGGIKGRSSKSMEWRMAPTTDEML